MFLFNINQFVTFSSVDFPAGHSILLRKLTPKHFSIEISGNIREYVKKIGQKKRNKRSAAASEGMVRNHVNQVDELEKFSADDGNDRDSEQISDDIDFVVNRNHKANNNGNQEKQQSKAANSVEYRDYAFDTTDTDRFNEDDDLLRRYYSHPVRRAANNDYDSFSDIMRLVGGEGDREDPFVKRLHYGNDDSFLNDESNADNDNDNDEFNSEYDEYDDY